MKGTIDAELMLPLYKFLGENSSTQEYEDIVISDGKYKDLTFHYNTIKLDRITDDEEGVLSFQYTIVNNPSNIDFEITENQKGLEDTIAAILYDIVGNSAGKIGKIEDAGTNYPEESLG
jgi:hypothetical protein